MCIIFSTVRITIQVCQHFINDNRNRGVETPLKSGQILPNRDIMIGQIIDYK